MTALSEQIQEMRKIRAEIQFAREVQKQGVDIPQSEIQSLITRCHQLLSIDQLINEVHSFKILVAELEGTRTSLCGKVACILATIALPLLAASAWKMAR